MKIKLGSFSVDLERLLETKLLIQANSGGGKSWAIRKLLEESNGKVQQIVIDIEGEFSSLREKYDYVLVGKDGELPASIKTAGVLAHRLLELNASAIIDLYELKHYERILYVKRFLDSLVNAPKELWHPVLVVIDEAHLFCPEAAKSESTQSVIDLCTRGRKRGQCAVLATQRISKLHKDASAECNNKLIGRTGQDIDRKRAADELGFTKKEDVLSLRNLEPGEFYAFGTAISAEVIKVKIGGVETSHPKLGARIGKVESPTPRAIKQLLTKLADLEKSADEELRTKEDYEKKIRSLTAELSATKRAQSPQKALEKSAHVANRIRAEAYNEGRDKGVVEASKQAEQRINKIVAAVQEAQKKLIQALGTAGKTPEVTVKKYVPAPPQRMIPTARAITVEYTENDLSNPQKRILEALAKLRALGVEEVPRPMLAAQSRASSRSSAYANNLSALRTRELIEYGSGTVHITEQGLAVIGEVDVPTSPEELQEGYRNMMSTPQVRLFNVLLDAYPKALTRDELAELAEVSSNSSAFANNLSALHTMGAIDYLPERRLAASKHAFLEL